MSLQIGVLLLLLVMAGVFTVVVTGLIRAAVGLAVTSVLLSVLIYEFGGPLAAVFELSVCAGLITVVIISAISLTEHQSKKDLKVQSTARLKRFLPLLFLVVISGISLIVLGGVEMNVNHFSETMTVNEVMWGERSADLFGQIVLILIGVFGVVVLFRERTVKKSKQMKMGDK